MAAPASDWLRHLRLPLWNRWTKFHDTWQEARSQRSLPSLCFCADQKNMVSTRPLIRWDIFDFSKTAEWNSTKLDGKQDVHVLYQVCVFRTDRKSKWPPGVWLADTFSTSPLITLNGIQRNVTKSKISTSSTKSVVFLGRSVNKKGRPGWSVKKVAHCTQVHEY